MAWMSRVQSGFFTPKSMVVSGSHKRWDRWHIIPQLAGKIPLIYFLLAGYMPPTTSYGNQKQPLSKKSDPQDPLNGPRTNLSIDHSFITWLNGVRWDSVPFNFWWTLKKGSKHSLSGLSSFMAKDSPPRRVSWVFWVTPSGCPVGTGSEERSMVIGSMGYLTDPYKWCILEL